MEISEQDLQQHPEGWRGCSMQSCALCLAAVGLQAGPWALKGKLNLPSSRQNCAPPSVPPQIFFLFYFFFWWLLSLKRYRKESSWKLGLLLQDCRSWKNPQRGGQQVRVAVHKWHSNPDWGTDQSKKTGRKPHFFYLVWSACSAPQPGCSYAKNWGSTTEKLLWRRNLFLLQNGAVSLFCLFSHVLVFATCLGTQPGRWGNQSWGKLFTPLPHLSWASF